MVIGENFRFKRIRGLPYKPTDMDKRAPIQHIFQFTAHFEALLADNKFV